MAALVSARAFSMVGGRAEGWKSRGGAARVRGTAREAEAGENGGRQS